MTHSQALVESIFAITAETIPASTYTAGKIILLDALGCALAGRETSGLAAVTEQVCEWGGKPEARLLTEPLRVPMPQAAFVNAAAIHALDFDDIYIPGTLHLNCMLVPAMLAAAETAGADGRSALAAFIQGYELAARIGVAEKSRRRTQGLLPTTLAGSFGAVFTAARLLGLSPEQTVHACGINYAQIAGNRQALLDASLTKRLQPAFAVRSAFWAVALAKRGLTGPLRIFEGESGYFKVYLNGEVPTVDEFVKSGPALAVERTSIKRYPSCGAAHSVQIAAESLYEEESIPAENIARVEVFGVPSLVSEPFELGTNPQVKAQFSGAWAVAHTLLRGPAQLGDYTDEAIRADRAVQELAQKIIAVPPPDDLPPPLQPNPAEGSVTAHEARYQGLVVHTSDGRRFLRCQAPCQTHKQQVCTWEHIEQKYRDCVDFAGIDPESPRQQLVAVRELDTADDISGLFLPH
jgi:2-methylcitrate dehydratase PrpD